jgi:hypothetical protein
VKRELEVWGDTRRVALVHADIASHLHVLLLGKRHSASILCKRDSACPIHDITEWTDWFTAITASPTHHSDSADDLVHADVASHLKLCVSFVV